MTGNSSTKGGDEINLLDLAVSVSTSGTSQVSRDLAAIEASGVRAEKSLGSSMKSLGSSLGAAGKTMSTFVTLPMAGLGAGMVKLAADAGESASKMEAVFGNATGEMNKWIGELRKTVPATTTELQGMSSSIQDLLVPLGMAPKEAQGLTKEVVTLAGDLASFNNIPMDEALEKLRSGMVGQYEPLLDFGVALSADTVKAEAMRMGLIKGGQELDANSRAQAALSLTMKGTTAAHGDAAKTAGSAANSFKFLWSQVKELGATLGKNLLPIITPVVQKMAALAGRVGELSPKWQAVILGVGAFVAALGPLLLIVGTVVSALGSLMLATGGATLGVAFGLAAAAVGSFLVAAAPFVAVAVAMAGAGLMLYRNWGKVAAVFAPAISAIKALGNAIAGLATGDIPRFLQGSRATPAALRPIIAIAAKVIGQLRMLGRSFRALGGMIFGWSKSSAAAWANLTPAWREVVLAIHSGVQRIKAAFYQVRAAVMPVLKQIGNGIKTGLAAAFKFLVSQAKAALAAFRAAWPGIKSAALPVITAVANALRTVLGAAFKFALSQAKVVVNWFKQNWPLIQKTASTVMDILVARVKTGFNLLKAIIWPVVKAIAAFWKANWDSIRDILVAVWNIIKTTISTAIKTVLNVIKLAMQVLTGDWRGAWQTIKNILSDAWDAMKSNVGNVLKILGNIIKIAWDNIKAITLAAWNAIRDYIGDKINAAKERAVQILKDLGQAAFDRYELMKASVKAAFAAIEGFMVNPIESAYKGIKDWVDKILGVVNTVLKAVGLDEIKIGGTESPGGNGSGGRGSMPAPRRYARGGITNPRDGYGIVGEAGQREAVVNLERRTPESVAALQAANASPNVEDRGRGGLPEPPDEKRRRERERLEAPLTKSTTAGGGVYTGWDNVNDSDGWAQYSLSGTRYGSAYSRALGAWDDGRSPIDMRTGTSEEHAVRIIDGSYGTGEAPAWASPNGTITNNLSKMDGYRPASIDAIATHEVGHTLGLGHGVPAPSIMNYSSTYDVGGVPTSNDWSYLQKLWGSGSGGGGKSDPSGEHKETDLRKYPDAFDSGTAPHVSEVAFYMKEKFPGIQSIGGYRPGDPLDHGKGLAIDMMTGPYGSTGANNGLMDSITSHMKANWRAMAVSYLISRQRIDTGSGWAGMEDRGTPTENHMDHVHASFSPSPGSGKVSGAGGGGGMIQNFLLDKFNKLWDSTVQPVADKFLKPLKDADYVMKNAAGAAGQKIPDGIKEWATKKLGLSGGGGGGSTQDPGQGGGNRAIGERMLKASGVSGSFPSLDSLWTKESNWDHRAQNPTSTAFGIPQFLDATWQQYGGKETQPTPQIDKGLKYIKDRYGSTDDAWAHSQANNWYSRGGMTDGAQRAVIGEAGRELVIPLENRAAMQASRNAMGTTEISERLQSLERALVDKLDRVNLDTPSANHIVTGGRNRAREVIKSTEGRGIIQTQNREINKTQSLRRGR